MLSSPDQEYRRAKLAGQSHSPGDKDSQANWNPRVYAWHRCLVSPCEGGSAQPTVEIMDSGTHTHVWTYLTGPVKGRTLGYSTKQDTVVIVTRLPLLPCLRPVTHMEVSQSF